ncbi:toll/interleukin-1 receptor domain-containing protein [Streptomyces sp. BA2]|uniref:toll/interleukin-1 receptor domain-containing protein n=1 Tax=Streptomyces sp. BA2 TaxID=436595 RepID=UPI00132508D2|nr:toll/interleukin-1 receptor domain-containing protein [Streptomyces sp. BA2]MWA11215.1 TIR domain-containing protein [Streptomyces sp. BA2]
MDQKKIFVSYRHGHSDPYAGWLRDRLAQYFGSSHVFMDVRSLDPGVDFPKVIVQAIAACDVLIALIGADWTGAAEGRSRISDKNDWVRQEVETALDSGIRVIPVLLQGAQLPSVQEIPSSLGRIRDKNALTLTSGTFEDDMRRLVSAITSVDSGDWGDDPAKRLERGRTIRFAEMDRQYRLLFDFSKLQHRNNPFIQPGFRRGQLDRLTDNLDPDEEVALMFLCNLWVDKEVATLKSDQGSSRALAALTHRRVIYVPYSGSKSVQFIPYPQIINLDRGLTTIILTLAQGNIGISSVKPLGKLPLALQYIGDRLTGL